MVEEDRRLRPEDATEGWGTNETGGGKPQKDGEEMGAERGERRCREKILWSMMQHPNERDGTNAPTEPTAVGTRAERHEAARRGLRRRPTGMGGRAVSGTARGG